MFAHELLALPTHRAFPLLVHRWNSHRAERLFVPTLITIQTLTQRCGIEPVILHPFATLIPVLGLHHVVLDAEFLHPTVQVEPERIRLITGHDVTGGILLFHHKEHKLWSCPVMTANPVPPVTLGVGVNTEFDGVVGGG